VQALVLALASARVELQELTVGVDLDGQQERHLQNRLRLPKSLRMRFFSVKE
jgi:hypothetical protein